MAAQRQIPGGVFINETRKAQTQIPGSVYVNQTQPVGITAIGSAAASGGGIAAPAAGSAG